MGNVMSNTIEKKEVVGMILAAVKRIRENHETLSKLDSATGDGDHGTTMLRSVKAVEDTINTNPDEKLNDLLYLIGWAIMSADGGSTGPLLGSFFMGMSEAADGVSELDSSAVAEMLIAGANKMQKQSRAQVGDKTMMDALLPAVDALKTADKSAAVQDILRQAAKAANNGSEATKDMKARFGRARNLGDRVIGHKDPGAVSISLIFQGFCDSFDN
jgi:dihydroxyacetone kinase-like protein